MLPGRRLSGRRRPSKPGRPFGASVGAGLAAEGASWGAGSVGADSSSTTGAGASGAGSGAGLLRLGRRLETSWRLAAAGAAVVGLWAAAAWTLKRGRLFSLVRASPGGVVTTGSLKKNVFMFVFSSEFLCLPPLLVFRELGRKLVFLVQQVRLLGLKAQARP